jgi:probable rRNA maturation factor
MPCLIELRDVSAGEHYLAHIDRDKLQRLIDTALADESPDHNTELGIILVDEAESDALHRAHFDVTGSTDVMSFPDGSINPENDRLLIGELVVCPAVAEAAAAAAPETRRAIGDELLLYILHGTLHCVGYDDIDEDDRRDMWQRQVELLAPLGIAIQDD